MRQRSLRTTDVPEVLEWCRNQNTKNPYPVTMPIRFGIAVYQIGQGLEWEGSDSSFESFMAACVHFMCVGEAVDLWLENELGADLKRAVKHTYVQISKDQRYRDMLFDLCKAQQMVVYWTTTDTERGKKRYDRKKFSVYLGNVIKHVLSLVPSNKMKSAIENATEVMTEKL